MEIDVAMVLGLVTRSVRNFEKDGKAASAVTLTRLYDTSVDDLWDAPKRPGQQLAGVRLSVERSSGRPRFLFASPDDQPALLELEGEFEGRYDTV